MSQTTLVQTAHNPQVSIVQGQAITTSLNVAEVFAKQHKHILRDIDNLLLQVPENMSKTNFGLSTYTDSTGKSNKYYELAFDGFMLLVMGFTGAKAMQFKIAYIEEFNRMREHLNDINVVDIPLTPSTAHDRRHLKKIADVWASQTRQKNNHCYKRIHAFLEVDSFADIPLELIPAAINFVQSKLDAHQRALCARQEQLPLTSERQETDITSEEMEEIERQFSTLENCAFNAGKSLRNVFEKCFFDKTVSDKKKAFAKAMNNILQYNFLILNMQTTNLKHMQEAMLEAYKLQ